MLLVDPRYKFNVELIARAEQHFAESDDISVMVSNSIQFHSQATRRYVDITHVGTKAIIVRYYDSASPFQKEVSDSLDRHDTDIAELLQSIHNWMFLESGEVLRTHSVINHNFIRVLRHNKQIYLRPSGWTGDLVSEVEGIKNAAV